MVRAFFAIFICLFSLSCGRSSTQPESQKPLVLVSIAPYKSLAQQIGGDAINVQTITPPSANPHAFEPTSNQVMGIAKGQIWFRIGEPFEGKILPLLSDKNPHLSVCDLREGIPLSLYEEAHTCSHCSIDHLDRHIWLSPSLMKAQAKTIARELTRSFPEHADQFQKRLEKCLADLEQLDSEIRALLEPLFHKSFIVSHSAFGYFCREYGLTQLPIEQEGKDPRPRYLEEMTKKAKNSHTELALALPQHNNKGAQLVAESLNVPVRMIDPYSTDYFAMMRRLAHLIANPAFSGEEKTYREGFKNREMPRRRPEFESGEAGAEAAKLRKFSDAGGSQILWLPDAGRTDFRITSGIQ